MTNDNVIEWRHQRQNDHNEFNFNAVVVFQCEQNLRDRIPLSCERVLKRIYFISL